MVKVKQTIFGSKRSSAHSRNFKNVLKGYNYNEFKKKRIFTWTNTMQWAQYQKRQLQEKVVFQRLKKKLPKKPQSQDIHWLNGNCLITQSHCMVQNKIETDHPMEICITNLKNYPTIFARTQKCTDKYIKTINTIFEYGKKHADHLKPLRLPISTYSKIVLVKYDNQYYRAIIIDQFKFIQKVKLFFIDFGDTKIVPILDVKQLLNRKMELLKVYIFKINLSWLTDHNQMLQEQDKLNTRQKYLLTSVTHNVVDLRYYSKNTMNKYFGIGTLVEELDRCEAQLCLDRIPIELYIASSNIYTILNNQLIAYYNCTKCMKLNNLINISCSGYFHSNVDGWTFSVRVLEENIYEKTKFIDTSVKKLKKFINSDYMWSLRGLSILDIKKILDYSQKHKHILLMEFFSKLEFGNVKRDYYAKILQFLQLFSIKDIRKTSPMFYQLDSFTLTNILCTLYGCISFRKIIYDIILDIDAGNMVVEFICEILNIINVQNIDNRFILISVDLCMEIWRDCYIFVERNQKSQCFNQIIDYIIKLNQNHKYFSNRETLKLDDPNVQFRLKEYAIRQINALRVCRYYIASEFYNRRKKASDIDKRKFIGLNEGTSNLLDITSDTTVHDLKIQIYQRFKIPLRGQCLFINKSSMNDYDATKVVSYFGESDNQLIHLFVYKLPVRLKTFNIKKKKDTTSITANMENLVDEPLQSTKYYYELKSKCCVCLDHFVTMYESIVLLNCNHNICINCLKTLIKESKDAIILCPYNDNSICKAEIANQDIHLVCTDEEYDAFLQRSTKQKSKNVYEELLLLDDSNIIKNTESFNCSLCIKDIRPGDGILLHECLHSFCQLCLREYIKNDVRSMITCPYNGGACVETDVDCNGTLQHREIKELCTSDEFDKFLNRSLQMLNEEHQYEELLSLDDAYFIENKDKFECAICLLGHNPGDGMILRECLHTFCKQCLHDYIKNNFDSVIKCPFTDGELNGCDGTLQHREIQALLTVEEFEKFLLSSITDAENKIGNIYHCIKPNCVGFTIVEDENEESFICCVCEFEQCMKCKVAMHTGITCEQYQNSLLLDSNKNRSEQQIADMIKNEKAMLCPNCKALIEKISGCDGLTCTVCKIHLCWATKGARWGKNGYGDTSGGCQCNMNSRRCHPNCQNCH